MTSARELLRATKAKIREVTPTQAEELRNSGAQLLDVREQDEFEQGAIPGAVHIPRGLLETSVEARLSDKSAPIVAFCAGGVRSAFAAETLAQMGYRDVVSMDGGFNQWKNEGRDWKVPSVLTAEQRNRYHRHLLLPEVGEEGQQKLLESKVLCLGAGGLGSPAALYLAAAGVGTLGIVDMDVVDESNLQRQILHNLDRVGERKVDSAKKTLVAFRFEGMVTVFDPKSGPTYRDMVPEAPPAELAPSCAEAGVLGALPGVVGTLQAIEALKYLLGYGDSLAGRLLAFDATEMSFREYKINPDPANEIIWENRDRIEVADLDGLCAPVPLSS